MLIDKISYGNPIKDINPGIKFLLSMTTLIFLLCTENKGVIVFNLVLFNLLLLFVVKVKVSDLLKLNFIPALFILTTVISLFLIKADIWLFLLRSFAGLSVVYFLICSTPIIDLDYIFGKLRFPKIFREMFLLIYRYIFLLFDNKEKLHNSQEVRLGYSSFKNSMKSFPMLVVAILRKTYYYNYNSIKAVESRLGKEFIFSPRRYKKVGIEAVFAISVIIINLYLVVKYYA